MIETIFTIKTFKLIVNCIIVFLAYTVFKAIDADPKLQKSIKFAIIFAITLLGIIAIRS